MTADELEKRMDELLQQLISKKIIDDYIEIKFKARETAIAERLIEADLNGSWNEVRALVKELTRDK